MTFAATDRATCEAKAEGWKEADRIYKSTTDAFLAKTTQNGVTSLDELRALGEAARKLGIQAVEEAGLDPMGLDGGRMSRLLPKAQCQRNYPELFKR